MKTLPTKVSKRMLEVVPHVNSALAQLEAFAAKYKLTAIYGHHGKHVYLHDFTLLLALDDLEFIGLDLFDRDGQPKFEHTINMDIAPQQSHSPLLDIFKSACEEDGPCAPKEPFKQFAMHPPIVTNSFFVIRKGTRSKNAAHLSKFDPFFVINWNTDNDDGGTGELHPQVTTSSHCDDTPPPEPLEALHNQQPLQITQNIAALPNYSD